VSWGALPPLLLLPCLAWFARRQQGSWLAPGAFFALAWALLPWMAILVAPDFYVWPPALWVIVIGSVAVVVGAIVGESLWAGGPVVAAAGPPALPGLRFLALAGAALGVIGVLILLRSLGQSPLIYFSPTQLAELGVRVAASRYKEGYVEPLLVRLLTTGTYVAALLGGCWAGLAPGRRGLAVWGGFVPVVATAAITTARALVLFCLVLWIGAYLAAGVCSGRELRQLLPRRVLLWGGIAIPTLFAGAVVLQLTRYGLGLDGLLYVLDRLRIWIAGFLAGFAVWLHSASDTLASTDGAFTFAGLFNLLGISTRTIGLYADFVWVKDGYDSNIYTAFRGILQDFGIIGGALTAIACGAAAGIAYGGVRRGHLIWLPVLAMYYGFVLFSHITSILNYNTIILAWVAFALLIPASRASLHLRASPVR
jgi:hypothetical protein